MATGDRQGKVATSPPPGYQIGRRSWQIQLGAALATAPGIVIQPPAGNSVSKGTFHSSAPLGTGKKSSAAYQRHEPEKTVLYRIVSEHLETFLGEVRDHYDKPLPKYVEKELRDYLRCGLLQYGFAKAICKQCGRTILVAFSCKKRGACRFMFRRDACATVQRIS